MLATITALRMNKPNRFKAIVTLDSPLGGIPSGTALWLALKSGCDLGYLAENSPWDMLPGSAFIMHINAAINATNLPQLYTINATPGYGIGIEFGSTCIPLFIPLVNNEHSKPSWQPDDEARHTEAKACTHTALWEGNFTEAGEAGRVVSFIECAIAQLPGNCKEAANAAE